MVSPGMVQKLMNYSLPSHELSGPHDQFAGRENMLCKMYGMLYTIPARYVCRCSLVVIIEKLLK